MTTHPAFPIAAAAILLGLSSGSFAQVAKDAPGATAPRSPSSGSDAPVPGTSLGTGTIARPPVERAPPRCEKLKGAAKERCLREEGTATRLETSAGTGSTSRPGPESTGMGAGAR